MMSWDLRASGLHKARRQADELSLSRRKAPLLRTRPTHVVHSMTLCPAASNAALTSSRARVTGGVGLTTPSSISRPGRRQRRLHSTPRIVLIPIPILIRIRILILILRSHRPASITHHLRPSSPPFTHHVSHIAEAHRSQRSKLRTMVTVGRAAEPPVAGRRADSPKQSCSGRVTSLHGIGSMFGSLVHGSEPTTAFAQSSTADSEVDMGPLMDRTASWPGRPDRAPYL